MNYRYSNKYTLRQKLLILSTSIYLFTLFVFVESEETLIYSKAAFLLAMAVAIFNIDLGNIYLTKTDLLIGAFAGMCLFSTLWSPLPEKSFEMGKTLIQLFVMFVVFRLGFRQFGSERLFVTIIAVSGLAMCLFYMGFYGVNGYVDAMRGSIRLGSEFENTNTIGGAAAFIFLSLVYLGIQKGKVWYILSVLPAIVMLGAGSRTGIVVALSGIVVILINYLLCSDDKNAFKKVLIISVLITALLYVFYNASEISFLHSTYEHFRLFFDALSGKMTMMGSTLYRMGMLRVGFELFISHPIIGNGINGTMYALYKAGIPYTVLHNNYIEILADLGIAGFSLYYGVYCIALKKAIKQFKLRHYFPLMLLVMMLALDIGGVTYYMQRNYLFLVFVTIALENEESIKESFNDKRYVFGNRSRRYALKK